MKSSLSTSSTSCMRMMSIDISIRELVVDKARKWIKKEEDRLGVTVEFDWESHAKIFIQDIINKD